jgi:hypothetical protein
MGRNGRGWIARLSIVFLVGVLASACGGGEGPDHVKLPAVAMPKLPPPPADPSALDPAALASPQYDAVLAAGDRSRTVGDDATETMEEQLQAAGTPIERLHSLSADPKRFVEDFYIQQTAHVGKHDTGPPPEDRIRKIEGGTDPASPALVLRRTLELTGKTGATCLVYLASTPDGAALKLRDGTITPAELDRALGGGCAAAPTVVIISGCMTGDWAAAPMARPNRLIITASAAGKTGFGCGPNVGFTTFDECLLGATSGAPDWATIFDRTRRCVLRREALVGQPSVEPQIYLGKLVASLPAPWRDTGNAGIVWRQGIGRYSIDGAPYYPTLRQRNLEALEAYRRAPPPRALALTFAGTVAFAAGVTGAETPDDVARIALQLCEWQSAGACILYARTDGLAASGPSGFPPIHPPMLARSGRFDPALVPFIRDDQRAALAAYRTKTGAKALAVGPATEAVAIGTGADAESARRAAVAACEHQGGSCVIYADDDRIVLADPP